MKLNFVAAAALALMAGQTFAAATVTEDFYEADGAFVYEFGAKAITLPESGSTFTFVLDSTDVGFSALSGVYDITGDISGSKYLLTGIKINGTAWDLSGGTSNVNLGSFNIGPASQIEIAVTGNRLGAGSNFQGSLVLTSAVPEPETYALMLGGLAAVGFMIRRRRQF
jgi:hypothetical protein